MYHVGFEATPDKIGDSVIYSMSECLLADHHRTPRNWGSNGSGSVSGSDNNTAGGGSGTGGAAGGGTSSIGPGGPGTGTGSGSTSNSNTSSGASSVKGGPSAASNGVNGERGRHAGGVHDKATIEKMLSKKEKKRYQVQCGAVRCLICIQARISLEYTS
jgi:hypothetical protein